MTSRSKFFIAFIVLFAGASSGQDPSEPVPAFPYETLYYYNGNIKVDVILALDELHIAAPKGQQLNTSALATRGTWRLNANNTATLRIQRSSASRTEIQSQLNAIRAAGNTARPILYSPNDTTQETSAQQHLTDQLSIKLKPQTALVSVLSQYNLTIAETVSYSPNTYIVTVQSDGVTGSLDTANALFESGTVDFATPIIVKPRTLRLTPNDSLFNQQWHLENIGQVSGAVPGNDVNIKPAWDIATGSGVNISIVDTGVAVSHPDLAPNARTDIDIDIRNSDFDPTPFGSSHGTSVAGIAAAKGNNAQGVTGGAFNAGIIGVRLDPNPGTTDAQEAAALNHQVNAASNVDEAHIINNSWGPPDDGQHLETMGPLTAAVVSGAVTNGRGGLGTIYVWAGGNGRLSDDNVNYDGYASSRYTIAVGATGGAGVVSWYNESGASLLVNAPSSYIGAGTTTTTGSSSYTSSFGGTSSASPLAAGIVALMLEVNPSLTWRDVQHILVNTSSKNDPTDPGWFLNGDSRFFNHNYGFGRIDALAAVTAAASWTNVAAEAIPLNMSESALGAVIPDNNLSGLSRNLNISGPISFSTEHIELTIDITHAARGNLRIELVSPGGTTSVLSEVHADNGDNYSNWTFTTVANWGESPIGTWTLRVIDGANNNTGTLNSWDLTVYGTAINAPIPTMKVPFFSTGILNKKP